MNDNVFTFEYLQRRNITAETHRFYDVKTKVSPSGVPISVGYPYAEGVFKVRMLDTKAFYSIGDISRMGLFGRGKFTAGSSKWVTVTEGEDDALSLWQVLHTPVVSVQSAGNARRDCIVEREWLNSFERVYLAFDNDVAGRDATRSVAQLFDNNKVFVLKLDRHKDATAYLEEGEEQELRDIWWNSKRYLPETIKSSFDDFKKILLEPPQHGVVSYPWKTLNNMTYGMRTGETVLITALEGVGKTEIMHALEYQLLTGSTDNVGAIFLEEPKRRHLEAIAGSHLRKPVHLPTSGVEPTEVIQAVQEAIGVDDRFHMYVHFGSDDPEVLLDTIRFMVSARSCRWILLDHITMAVSGSAAGEDERRNLDYLSTRLEMMVKELDFGLIVVSHVNDLGQTRGSRYISKIADIRIDLTRDFLNPDPVVSNTVTLIITKPSRFSGRSGYAGQLYFDPVTHTFTEVDGGTPAQLATV